jgi:electron transfer flavoprotein beta subunit
MKSGRARVYQEATEASKNENKRFVMDIPSTGYVVSLLLTTGGPTWASRPAAHVRPEATRERALITLRFIPLATVLCTAGPAGRGACTAWSNYEREQTMNIVVCIKYVPDSQADLGFIEPDNTTDRLGVDGLLSELDEYAIEAALKLVEAEEGQEGGVTVLTVGPGKAADAIKKSLQMGAHAGVHVNDEAIHGSDAAATSLILAEAIKKIGATSPTDLVLTGMASTDGTMGVIPAMLAERLGLPQVTLASELTVAGGTVTIRRDGDVASETITASLPALVSVTDQINEPRYPSFKGIMAAKKKPVQTWSLADLGLDASSVGLGAAWTKVESFTRRPPRAQGQIVTDEGEGGTQLAEFLSAHKFV